MNGFKIMLDAYKKADISEEERRRYIRIYEFLSECDDQDFCYLFDSTAFNEICMSYVRKAVARLVDNEVIDEEQARSVRNEVSALFSDMRAEEVL